MFLVFLCFSVLYINMVTLYIYRDFVPLTPTETIYVAVSQTIYVPTMYDGGFVQNWGHLHFELVIDIYYHCAVCKDIYAPFILYLVMVIQII